MANIKETFANFLNELSHGRMEAAGAYLHDDFLFESPLATATNREVFITQMKEFASMARGHEGLEMVQEGDILCARYRFKLLTPEAGEVAVAMAEWLTFDGSKLRSSTLYFNPAALGR